jgi:hypothetical protein
MIKLNFSIVVVNLRSIFMSLIILVFVLFNYMSPALASIPPAPADNPPHESNMVDNSNLADAVPSASASTEPEFWRCKPGCRWDSSIPKCVPMVPGNLC